MSSAHRPLAKPATLFAALLSFACGEGTPAGSGGAGGAAAGGVGQGGAAGNISKGGASSGGAATGGAASGGAANGGTPNGGTPNGGTPNGGTPNGGSGGTVTSNGCNGAVTTLNLNPFGCGMAWGANADSPQQRGAYAGYMNFVSSWVLSAEPDLAQEISNTDAIPVYYGYIIGDTGHQLGYEDCNVNSPPNLCTEGAEMIREHRSEIIAKYAAAAQKANAANNGKVAVWLLEGDFIQYNDPQQGQPLSFTELGQLTEEITCAIKTNQPNAVVAMNHTTWNGDDETDDFWAAMPMEILDMVWTTGRGNNNGYIRGDGAADSYNATTARYDYISNLTQRKIFVDESFGASIEPDTWLNQQASTINPRIGEGVIAVNVTGRPETLPPNLPDAVSTLTPQLGNTCQ